MRFLFTLLTFLLVSIATYSQEMVDMIVITKDYKTDKKEGGAIVKVYDGATVVQTFVSPSNGKITFQLPAGKVYKLEISKAGKVTRYTNVNLKGVTTEAIQGSGNVQSPEISVGLFEELPGIDYSYVKSNPFTEFYFQSGNPQLQYDDIVAGRMKNKIDKIIADSEKQKGAADAQYNEAIKNADALYNQKKYEEALKQYEAASSLKPTDKYPADRIVEIDGIIKAQKNANAANAQIEEDYKNLINAANTLRDQKKYEEAIAKYNEALTKKQEQYPKDEIVKCQTAMANAKKEAENQAKYDQAMKDANGFFTQKSWMAAKDKFKEALKFKPNDPVATAKLAEIDGKLNEQKAEQDKKKKFDETVAAADALFGQEKWVDAKAKYQEALTMNSAATYPSDKIKECDTKLGEIEKEKAKQAQIEKLLAEGNTAFTANQLPAAKTKFQEVLKLDDKNATALAKIAEVDAKIADEKANAEKIAQAKALVTEGDALAKAGKNPEAKAKYEAAQAIREDAAVKAKIDAIDALIAAAAQKAEQKAKFDKAIQEGDAALAANDLTGAKAKYTEAQTLDPASTVPKAKIAEVDKRIAADEAVADKQKKYAEAYQKGMDAMSAKDYAGAKVKFLEAIATDNTKQEAKDRLAEVDKIIADNAAAAANQAKYEVAMKAGDDLAKTAKYAEAKAKYAEAQKIDPTQTAPAAKIQEMDAALANADKAKQVAQLITEASAAIVKKDASAAKAKLDQAAGLDPGNAQVTAKQQELAALETTLAGEAAKKAQFETLKMEGMELAAKSEWASAKDKLTQAKALQADAEIDKKIAEIDKKIAEASAAAQNKAKYDAAIADATGLQAAGKLTEAKTKYQEASKLDPSQALPVEKIKEIDAAIANAEKTKQVNQLLTDGNSLLAKNDLTGSKAKFQQVITLDPSNATASSKLQEIAVLESQAMDAAAKKQQFETLKKAGMDLFATGKYSESKQKLLEAKAIQADPAIDQKLTEIEAKMAEASSMAEKKAKYDLAMSEGNALQASGKLPEAKVKFQEASSLDPTQQAPKDKIKDVDFAQKVKAGDEAVAKKDFAGAVKLYDEALALKNESSVVTKRQEAEKAASGQSDNEADDLYKKILELGQRSIDEKNFIKAKDMYNRAIKLRPGDTFPKQKLDEIDALMKAEKEQQEKLEAYTKKMGEAEAAAKVNKLENAISLYEQAKSIKPDETLPDERIAAIRLLLAKKPDPALEASKKYNEAMTAGNASASAKEYTAALKSYQDALTIKPGDKPAADKVAEMKQLLDDLAKSEKNKAEIDGLITKADALFAKKEWSNAKAVYEQVLSKQANNAHAISQIELCDKKMIEDLNDEENRAYQKIVLKGDENFDTKDYKKAKDYYKRALTIRPSDPYPKKRLQEIEDLLNPKTTPPSLTTLAPPVANKEPEKLPTIPGTQTDNSLVEGQKRLEEASKERKSRIGSRFKKKVDKINDGSGELANQQKEKAVQNDGTLSTITVKNALAVDSSQAGREENIAVIDEKEKQIENEATSSQIVKEAAIQDQKSQLNLTQQTVDESNSILDGSAITNAEVLKEGNQERQDLVAESISEDHKENLHTDTQFTEIRIKTEQKVVDEGKEHDDVRQSVQDAVDRKDEISVENQDKEDVSVEAMNQKLVKVNNTVSEKQMEDMKQAPVNKEELNKISLNYVSQQLDENEEHQQNSLKFKEVINEKENVVSEYDLTANDARKENAEKIKQGTETKEELDRIDFNKTYEKSLNNTGEIQNEVIETEKYANLPSVVGEQNTIAYQQLNDGQQEKSIATAQDQQLKHEGNQKSLDNSRTTVESNSTTNTDKPNNNAEVLKEKQSGLGAQDRNMEKEKMERTLEQKKLLSEIEKQEMRIDEKTANDLGKLFPEGVSQEQYDQVGSDGLVSAIVTRRIVVRNGHGDVYMRTQTIEGITYSKNGQPCTEITWQRETQDSKLQRNY
jgi:tetratricopeptide (TPR) repeat protein